MVPLRRVTGIKSNLLAGEIFNDVDHSDRAESHSTAWRIVMSCSGLTAPNLSRSLEFNLKSRVFCELFPDLKLESQNELDRRKSLVETGHQDSQVQIFNINISVNLIRL